MSKKQHMSPLRMQPWSQSVHKLLSLATNELLLFIKRTGNRCTNPVHCFLCCLDPPPSSCRSQFLLGLFSLPARFVSTYSPPRFVFLRHLVLCPCLSSGLTPPSSVWLCQRKKILLDTWDTANLTCFSCLLPYTNFSIRKYHSHPSLILSFTSHLLHWSASLMRMNIFVPFVYCCIPDP